MTSSTFAHVAAFGPPQNIQITTGPLPEPGRGEVRVRVEASSVQFTDTLIRSGQYPDVRKAPVVLGYDVVGRVDAVGPGVQGWRQGDRVADLTMVGGNATVVVRPASGLVRVPEACDAAEVATLVLSWVTAYQCLVRFGQLQPGETVLVHGGMGAVGQAAIAIARSLGASAVLATARASDAAAISAMGATPIDYRTDWAAQVKAKGGADVIVDGVGERAFLTSRSVLRPGGRLIPIGVTAGARSGSFWAVAFGFFMAIVVLPLWPGRRTRFYGITQHRKKHPEHFIADLTVLLGWLAEGKIRPVVAERIGFHQIAEAHRRLEAGGVTGKIVLIPA